MRFAISSAFFALFLSVNAVSISKRDESYFAKYCAVGITGIENKLDAFTKASGSFNPSTYNSILPVSQDLLDFEASVDDGIALCCTSTESIFTTQDDVSPLLTDLSNLVLAYLAMNDTIVNTAKSLFDQLDAVTVTVAGYLKNLKNSTQTFAACIPKSFPDAYDKSIVVELGKVMVNAAQYSEDVLNG